MLAEKILKANQLDEAIKYLADLVRSKGAEAPIVDADFNREAGVGVVVTDEEVASTLDAIFAQHMADIKEQGASFEFNKIIYQAREQLKWADSKKVMEIITKRKNELMAAAPKDEAKKPKKVAAPPVPKEEEKGEDEASTGKSLADIIGRDIEAARNSEEALKKHNAVTGGKIMTRFPPEPNGYLHIGHAKAMRFNFTFAKEKGGLTYLRYDDTNPVKEN